MPSLQCSSDRATANKSYILPLYSDSTHVTLDLHEATSLTSTSDKNPQLDGQWPQITDGQHLPLSHTHFSSLTILLFMLDTLVPVTILLAVILLGNLTVVMGSNRGKQHFPHLWRVVAGALVALLMNHVRLMYPGEAQTIVVLWDRWFSYRSHQIQSGRGSNQTSTEGEKLPATRARKHPAVSRNILDKYLGYKRL